MRAMTGLVTSTAEPFEAALAVRREYILSEMAQSVKKPGMDPVHEWMENLLNAFSTELTGESPGLFYVTLEGILRQVNNSGGDLALWQDAISMMRRLILPCLVSENETLLSVKISSQAEDLWGQARVLIAKMTEQGRIRRTFQEERQTDRLRRVGQALISTFNVSQLMAVLVQKLPGLGIPGCYLSLYENPQAPTEWSRLIMAYDEQGRIELEPGGQRFPSDQFVPEGILRREKQYSMMVEPLYFRETQLGFVLFEMGPQEGVVYATLRGQISSALQGALLTEARQRAEEAVTKRANELETVAFVSAATSTLLYTDRLLQRVVNLTKNSFDLYHVHIYLLDTDAEILVLVAGAGEVGQQMVAKGWQIPLKAEKSLVARAARTRQGQIVNNVRSDPNWLPNSLLPNTCAELAVPLIMGNQVLGVLDVQADENDYFTEEDIRVQSTLATQIAAALKNAQLFEQITEANTEIQKLNEQLKSENLRMEAELDVTRQLQQMLLPSAEELHQIEGLDIAGFMEPADEVGGDYYDVLQHSDQVKIGIGDVTGHGLESGVLMLMTQTAVRTLMISGEKDPVRFLDILNRTLHDNIERMKVTKSLTLALLDYQSGQMRLSGQHEQVIVVRRDGQTELKDTLDLGFPLALDRDIALSYVNEVVIDLQPGDGVVLYSDGITEAESEAHEFYGIERLCTVVSRHWALSSAKEIQEAVIDNVRNFIGKQKIYDDLTLLIIKQQ